jgi:hypothetical protein
MNFSPPPPVLQKGKEGFSGGEGNHPGEEVKPAFGFVSFAPRPGILKGRAVPRRFLLTKNGRCRAGVPVLAAFSFLLQESERYR